MASTSSKSLPDPVAVDVTEMNSEKLPAMHAEKVDGNVRLYDSTGHIRRIPVPTTDPRDPLTWSSWKLTSVIVVVVMYGICGFGVVQSTPLFFGDLIPEYMKETRGQFNPSTISDLASYPSLCMGLGNFLFVPLSLAFGRRPIILFCSALMVAATAWAAKSGSFNSHLGARCLQGLSCGISDCLLPLIILDVTFLHRRGFWMGLYWAITAIGSCLLLVAVPYLVHYRSDNWRVNYWFWFGISLATLILATFLLPETLFDREPTMLAGQVVVTDAYGRVQIFSDPETAMLQGYEVSQPAPATSTSAPTTSSSFLSHLRFYYPTRKSAIAFLNAYISMGFCLLIPAVFWTLLLNSTLFGGLVALSLTYSQLLESPPWLLSAQSVGTVLLGAALGSLLGFAITGTTIDKLSAFFTRRNKGIREPEHLLPSFVLPTLFAFGGMVLYGVVGARPQDYSYVGIHAAFALYYCGFVTLSALTGVWLAELVPAMAGPCLVLVCGGRNAVSFGISYSFTTWGVAAGFQNSHVELGCLVLGIAVLGAVPLWFFGKALRSMRIWKS